MTRRSVTEYAEAIRGWYFNAPKKAKTKMLDEFVATTGMHRKAVIRLLNRENKSPGKKRSGRRVTYALANCYSSVRFLFTIAQLIKARVIDSRLLYILYYHEVTGYLTNKLRFLIQWCGTGLDLAADYDSYELARIVIALTELLKELNNVHVKHSADLSRNGYKAVIARFEERTRGFLSDPGRFSVLSDNYVDNYIEIIKK